MCNNADSENRLGVSHSCHVPESHKLSQTNNYSKSDFNFSLPTTSTTNGTYVKSKSNLEGGFIVYNATSGDYYKKYEHDKVPVKYLDSSARPVTKGSFTNSDLEKLEKRVYKKISQELQTDDSSLANLESDIKFFKVTVENIFENFYTSMRDFEHYKTRFHEILDRSKETFMDDMEDFIKDMIDHIMVSVSDNTVSKISCHYTEIVSDVQNKCVSSCGDSSLESQNVMRIVEAYKNENYLTDSTLPENTSKTKQPKIDELLNICRLGGNPYFEIKLDGRNLLSEINIKKRVHTVKTGSIASADNLNKLATKKLELEKYIKENDDDNMPDRDIPVKISFAKKNIHLNEDFSVDLKANNEASKSFLSKICNILCRKFRKSYAS